MKITWRNINDGLITTQENRPATEHFALLESFYQKEEILIDNKFYQIKALLISPPMENPPDVQVTALFLRVNQAFNDYC